MTSEAGSQETASLDTGVPMSRYHRRGTRKAAWRAAYKVSTRRAARR